MHRGIINRIGLAAIAGCVAVGALALAGCGGGSSTTATGASGASGASGSAPLSQSEFVSQANAVCKEGNTKIEALTPPSNLQSDWDKLIADAKKKEALAQKTLADAKANDTSAFNADIQQIQALGGSGDALASSIGLTECAKDASPQG